MRIVPAEVDPLLFPARVVAEVKAPACELPAKLGVRLSRFSRSELRRHVLAADIVRVRGTDERLAIESFANSIRFFHPLLVRLDAL